MKCDFDLKKVVVGEYVFGSETDITDPCYDRDVWCRINDIPTVPGKYVCIAYFLNDENWGNRIAMMRIEHESVCGIEDIVAEEVFINEIGVDAGLAGFFNKKPDYTDDEWVKFCNDLGREYPRHKIVKDGFVCSSGYGDGEYPVYGHKENNRYDTLEIRFIDPYDEDEDEDDAE